ncbi:MAG: LysR family transcriptional regulator [Hyphomicrobiales bacterium]
MKPNSYQISAFCLVARHRSFSRAAQALGVTQSSVTQHVGKLERLMEARLFIRNRDGLVLTPAGADLFQLSDRLKTLEEAVYERVSNYQKLEEGHLKIIATAPRPSMQLISTFSAAHPGIHIDFSPENWTNCNEAVKNRTVDMAIFTDPIQQKTAIIHVLRKTRYLAYVSKEHYLANRSSTSLKELVKETLILPDSGSLTNKIVCKALQSEGLALQRSLQMKSFPVVKEAALHNLGVAILLEDSLHPSPDLEAIPIVEMQQTHQDCLVLPEEKQNLRLVKRFTEIALSVY